MVGSVVVKLRGEVLSEGKEPAVMEPGKELLIKNHRGYFRGLGAEATLRPTPTRHAANVST